MLPKLSYGLPTVTHPQENLNQSAQQTKTHFGMNFHVEDVYKEKISKAVAKMEVFDEILSYIQKFKDKVYVIKIGGSIMKKGHEEQLTHVLENVATLKKTGSLPVIVHGGGPAIDEELALQQIPRQFRNGHRYTDDQTLSVVANVLPKVGKSLTEILKKFGVKAKAIQGTEILESKKKFFNTETGKVDIGWVGEIKKVRRRGIDKILKENKIPVISPIGKGAKGQKFNINADTAALEIAKSLNAESLVYITDVKGIALTDKNGEHLISEITPREIKNLIKEKLITGGMIPKTQAAADAVQSGKIDKVQIIDGKLKDSLLLELYTQAGVGTIIKK